MIFPQPGSLSPNFFDGDVESVAKALIGIFVFKVDQFGIRTEGKIVETEACGQKAPAAHSYYPDGTRPLKLGAAEAMFLGGEYAGQLGIT